VKVYRTLEEVPLAARAVAVGTFDGVHRGHRQVIESAREWARANGVLSTVLTFDPHPLRVLRPDEPPRLLTSTAVKIDLISELGVDELVVVPFTPEFSRLEAEAFCEEVLAGTLGARQVSVGKNFRFGHDARGDAAMLAARREFEVAVVPLLEVDGAPVSSTRIRDLVEAGDVAAARELLGHPFLLEGTVVEGDARGRELGIPTANVAPEPEVIVPAVGIYAGTARDRPAAISIGVRPTFEREGELLVEAYLLDFEGDLYGEKLRLAFLERLRDEERFDSPEELVEQMRRDVERVRELAGR
jgi:riboflavin kinase/FMN adenylyltransferase